MFNFQSSCLDCWHHFVFVYFLLLFVDVFPLAPVFSALLSFSSLLLSFPFLQPSSTSFAPYFSFCFSSIFSLFFLLLELFFLLHMIASDSSLVKIQALHPPFSLPSPLRLEVLMVEKQIVRNLITAENASVVALMQTCDKESSWWLTVSG